MAARLCPSCSPGWTRTIQLSAAVWRRLPEGSTERQSSPPCAAWPASANRSDRTRLSALTILDRYLDEPIDDSLMAGLQDSDSVALRSLNELIAAMTEDETAVIEYLVQLATQPPEVLGIILDAVPRLPPHPYLVTLLRMIAQGESPSGARTAIEQLGRLRMPEALSALDALALTLSSAFSPLAERSARKLRMSGVRAAESHAYPEAALGGR